MTGFRLLMVALVVGLAGLLPNHAQAQCTGGTMTGSIAPTLVAQTIPCVLGGQYYTFTGVAGTTYQFSFCNNGGTATFDTQITILDNGGNPVGYNDDFCGLQSEVQFTPATTGTYRVLVNNYFCNGGTTCGTLSYIELPPAGPGANCGNPFIVPALPYSNTGMTTCGFGDDYSSADACGSSYMNGDDFVFLYTSPGNESVTITLSNTGTYTGVFLLDGCPNGGGTTCMPLGSGTTSCTGGSGTNEASGGNPFGTWDITAAGTYYIVVSTFPSPQCTGFDISITSAPITGGGGVGNGCYSINTGIPYTPASYTTGTPVVFPDDEFSGVLPIGFNFCFNGAYYSDFVISSNGYITFNTSCANQYSTYVTEAIPNTTVDEIRNSILGFWQDIDPGVGGQIRYNLAGAAPYRRLVVNFNQIPMFSSACNSQLFTGQIILYETTNEIEVYIQNKTICSTWNGGNAVQGLLDLSGTVANVVGGRNNTNWTTTNDAVRFSPNCLPCQNILGASYLSLTGTATREGNLIQWETHYEESIDRFVLEKSRDGEQFMEVATLGARGNEQAGAAYDQVDDRPFSPSTFYRLREVSQNGELAWSAVIEVQSDLAASPLYNAFVDEQTGDLVVELALAEASRGLQLKVVDGLGRVQHQQHMDLDAGRTEVRIPVQELSAGYYFLQVSGQNNLRGTRKFVLY